MIIIGFQQEEVLEQINSGMIVKSAERRREDRMMELIQGMLLGFACTSVVLYFSFRNKCQHDWVYKGEQKTYDSDSSERPIYRDDKYQCSKCKKNKRERI